ncbi:MAG: hypothetical protein CM15mP58_10300 [Burkholderiaceae bacterium]|nr:MAG: hypothetical protein CM15mP58_10300 [Burkholderiaceae bacterium]
MKSNIFILIIFTISSLMLFGCDQIMDRSLGKISKTKNNESTLTNKESSLKSLDDSNKENSIKKPEEKKKIAEEDLSKDNSKELKKKYDVIGTNKDGPYRSGETNRIRSTK